MVNFLITNSSATILCPIAHSWTLNYGRHNHGHCTFIEPWSGYYQLGAPFWTQAHITQFIQPQSWYFLNTPSSNQYKKYQIYYVTFLNGNNGNFTDFTIVITNEESKSYNLTFEYQNKFLQFINSTLYLWKSTEYDWFVEQNSTQKYEQLFFNKNNNSSNKYELTVLIESNSIVTITTLSTGGHKIYSIPQRFQFPIPFINTFDNQTLGEPGRRLSDLYGAFDVNIDPTDDTSTNYVLKQAAVYNPGNNQWHRFNSLPITTFPSGTNFLNYNISSNVLCNNSSNNNCTTRVCGHIPIWEPDGYTNKYSLGVCLSLKFGNNYGIFKLEENSLTNGSILLSSYSQKLNNSGIIGQWSYISIGFFGDNYVQAIIDDYISDIYQIKYLFTGVAGIGSNWGSVAYFDNVKLELNKNHIMTPNGSFILDCLVGNINTITNVTNINITNNSDDNFSNINIYVGFVISMDNADTSLKIKQLGRFRVPNIGNMMYSNQIHEMNIIQVLNNEYKFLLPTGENNDVYSIDMANCVSDLNGFCYTNVFDENIEIELEIGGLYYVVSKEYKNGDFFMNMSDPATGTTYENRDGLTYMSYLAPNKGEIIARVIFEQGNQSDTPVVLINNQIDTSYGPVNFVVW